MALDMKATGPELFQTQPDQISFCFHGTIREPVQNGYKQIQNWTCLFWRASFGSRLVPEWPCVTGRTRSISIRLEPVLSKHNHMVKQRRLINIKVLLCALVNVNGECKPR